MGSSLFPLPCGGGGATREVGGRGGAVDGGREGAGVEGMERDEEEVREGRVDTRKHREAGEKDAWADGGEERRRGVELRGAVRASEWSGEEAEGVGSEGG